eukprot:457624-Pyramimonas_sp.AAC.1
MCIRDRSKIPFPKWKVNAGKFCGPNISQDPRTNEITVSQKEFAGSMKPAGVRPRASPGTPATDKEIANFRAMLGSGN